MYVSSCARGLQSCKQRTIVYKQSKIGRKTVKNYSQKSNNIQQSFTKRSVLEQAACFGLYSLFFNNFQEAKADVLESVAGFWKTRQQANVGKLLAPIEVSIIRLQKVEQAMNQKQFQNAQQLLRQASLNCYTFEALQEDSFETKASLFTQNFKIADPCTLRIILKNVSSQLPSNSAIGQQMEEDLEGIIVGFENIDSLLDSPNQQKMVIPASVRARSKT
eukprot:TRINITY_DN26013_c1_g1_i2.p2 TRINITY_DN26013_c1_g1~~TRINITY_DN26013_c1_g1_i2.p2  ORF type:complete len:219 (-),score=13.76 TRINITY_DN26013_c1_g1_i2:211-867(-)